MKKNIFTLVYIIAFVASIICGCGLSCYIGWVAVIIALCLVVVAFYALDKATDIKK